MKIDCTGCSTRIEVEEGTKQKLCKDCTSRLGVQHPPRAPRTLPCARCGHGILVRCALRQRNGEAAQPLAATFEMNETKLFSAKRLDPNFSMPLGVFEAFICRACGFTDVYCHEPEKIPIGIEHGTELVDLGKTPYR